MIRYLAWRQNAVRPKRRRISTTRESQRKQEEISGMKWKLGVLKAENLLGSSSQPPV